MKIPTSCPVAYIMKRLMSEVTCHTISGPTMPVILWLCCNGLANAVLVYFSPSNSCPLDDIIAKRGAEKYWEHMSRLIQIHWARSCSANQWDFSISLSASKPIKYYILTLKRKIRNSTTSQTSKWGTTKQTAKYVVRVCYWYASHCFLYICTIVQIHNLEIPPFAILIKERDLTFCPFNRFASHFCICVHMRLHLSSNVSSKVWMFCNWVTVLSQFCLCNYRQL